MQKYNKKTTLTTDEKYMQRCLELARKGAGSAAPNPMVGAVIVSNGEVIGEGFHRCCGEAHAEVNAINAVKNSELLKKSTLYVNLEPCSHYGKTPPCALKIVECAIPRVVMGHKDPFPKVAGGGVKMLREAGVEVITDVLHAECAELNKRFFTFHETRRPYIILKWAQSADGFIAPESRQSLKISTPETEKLVHQLRAEEAAIMVGTRTALNDNPRLTVRLAEGKNPVRVVIDRSLKIPQDYHLFDDEAETLVFTEKENRENKNIHYINVNFQNPVLPQILEALYRRNLLSLIVEGGAILLQSFIDENLFDEIHVETARNLFLKKGVKAPEISTFSERCCVFGENMIQIYYQKATPKPAASCK